MRFRNRPHEYQKKNKMEQRTVEWFEARKGKFSASEIHKLMGKTINTDTAQTYILEKATEEISEIIIDPFDNKAMEYGRTWEPVAKSYYSEVTGHKVNDFGFKLLNEHAGCSPDGLIDGQQKGLEIKCPYLPINHTKHLLIENQEQLKSERKEYYYQVMFSMLCFGFKEWDFVSFSPVFKGCNRMVIIPVYWDKTEIDFITERLNLAIELKKNILKKLEI